MGAGCSGDAGVGSEPSLPPQPMLSPSTGKPGSGAENCTVHVMGNSPQLGKPVPATSPSARAAHGPGGGSRSPSLWPGRRRPAERLPLHALGHVIMKQSYVCALIAMMVRGWGGGGGVKMMGGTSRAEPRRGDTFLPACRCGASPTTAG